MPETSVVDLAGKLAQVQWTSASLALFLFFATAAMLYIATRRTRIDLTRRHAVCEWRLAKALEANFAMLGRMRARRKTDRKSGFDQIEKLLRDAMRHPTQEEISKMLDEERAKVSVDVRL